MRRLTIGLMMAAVLAGGALAQDKKKKKRDIEVDFTNGIGWGGCYRPLEWTPLTVGITMPFEEPMDCIISISASQDEINKLHIRRREVLMPDRPRLVPLVTKFNWPLDTCDVSVESTRGYYWFRRYDLGDSPAGQLITEVEPKDILIGVSGRQGFGLMQLPNAAASRYENKSGRVYVKFKFARRLPADWTGYASLDLFVLYNPDWLKLTGPQCRAIVQWVHNGGRMLVVLGGNPLPPEHPIARLLPFKLGPVREVQLSRPLMRRWGASSPKVDKLACWSLDNARGVRGWETRTEETAAVLSAFGPAGFGKVGVFAADVSAIGGRQDRNTAPFWIARIAPLLGSRRIRADLNPDEDEDSYGFNVGRPTLAANTVLEHLLDTEKLRPIHIGWVVLVLVSLAVLIGPVDYLVLKKLGRLPMTWLTASVCIGLFSVGAYYGVEYLRGGKLEAKVVTVIDGIEGSPAAWTTRYTGIFAPHSDEYRISGLDRSQWWAGLTPTQGERLSRFRRDLGSRNIYCIQHTDGGNVPTSVPINIWTMQCLLSESPAPAVPLRATVTRDNGRWTVHVENLADAPIEKGYVLVGSGRCVSFGPVAAKATAEFTGPEREWRSWTAYVERHSSPRNLTGKEYRQAVFLARGCDRRTEGILEYVAHADGAAVVCAEYTAAPVGFDIAGRTCDFVHTQLVRLVVPKQGS